MLVCLYLCLLQTPAGSLRVDGCAQYAVKLQVSRLGDRPVMRVGMRTMIWVKVAGKTLGFWNEVGSGGGFELEVWGLCGDDGVPMVGK